MMSPSAPSWMRRTSSTKGGQSRIWNPTSRLTLPWARLPISMTRFAPATSTATGGLVVLPLVLGLPDAQDRGQAGVEGGRHLEREGSVDLTEVGAPLGVSEHDAVDVHLAE